MSKHRRVSAAFALSKMKPKPFVLPPVLEVLFRHCDFETLKAARLVCRLWFNVSSSTFNQNTLINFYSMYPETYIDVIQSVEAGCKFNPVNVALTLSPLQNAEPLHDSRNLTVCPHHACEEFIFPFGASIECLKFYAWDAMSDKLNGALFSQILLTPYHLRSLEISLLPSAMLNHPLFPRPWNRHPPLSYLTTLVMYGKMECSEEFLNNFLSAMPRVNGITVNCCCVEFLNSFTFALHQVPLARLHHLKLNFVGMFTESHILNMKKATLGLKTLHIAPRCMVTKFDEYTRLLTQLSRTLEDAKLTVCTRLQSLDQYINIPLMPKLRFLRLQSWRGGPGVWNLSFINNTPNLESLVMERRGFFVPVNPQGQIYFLEGTDVKVHKCLRNLVLPTEPVLFLQNKSNELSLLLKFPYLAKLSISANDDTLEGVFQNAPQLEDLTIAEYSRISDDGLTGLVSGNFGKQVDCECVGQNQVNYNVKVGITALKALKRLELDGFWGTITDFSVNYGIKHLCKLESVMFRGCKISERSLKILSKMQVIIVGHDALHTFEPEEIIEDRF